MAPAGFLKTSCCITLCSPRPAQVLSRCRMRDAVPPTVFKLCPLGELETASPRAAQCSDSPLTSHCCTSTARPGIHPRARGHSATRLLSFGHVICMEYSSWIYSYKAHLTRADPSGWACHVGLSSQMLWCWARCRGPWGLRAIRPFQRTGQCRVSLNDRFAESQKTGLEGTSQVQLIHFLAAGRISWISAYEICLVCP